MGDKERAVKALAFDFLSVYRPGTILGNTNTPKVLGHLMSRVDWPLSAKYHAIHKNDLARAMVAQSEQDIVHATRRLDAKQSLNVLEFATMKPRFVGGDSSLPRTTTASSSTARSPKRRSRKRRSRERYRRARKRRSREQIRKRRSRKQIRKRRSREQIRKRSPKPPDPKPPHEAPRSLGRSRPTYTLWYSRPRATAATRMPRAGVSSDCWARTSDPMINSHLLYQLS